MFLEQKLLIITTDPTFGSWKSRGLKLANAHAALNQVKNGNFKIDVVYRDIKPDVFEGSITHSYMNSISYPQYRLGYDFVGIHMSDKQRKAWGIQPTVRGAYQIDTDFVSEFYFWADEKSKRNGLDQWLQVFLHEVSHAIARGCKVADITHAWHDKHTDISGIFSTYDMSLFQREAKGMEKALKAIQADINLLAVRFKKYPNTLWPAVARKANELERQCALEGIFIRVTEGVRSCERQTALYLQGRSLPGNIVTNAKCGESLHQYGVAFDIAFRDTGFNGPWEKVGKIGEKLGLSWGGRWKSFPDRPHFELPLSYSLADFQSGKVDYKLYF